MENNTDAIDKGLIRPHKRLKWSIELNAVLFIVLLLLITTVISPSFWRGNNLTIIFDRVTVLLLLGMGLTFVLMSGSVNLAVGSMLSLNSVLLALLSRILGLWAMPVVILLGYIEGLLTGVIFSKLKIPSFIATFGMMGVYSSLAIIASGGSPISISRELIVALRVFNVKLMGIKVIYLITIAIFLLFLFVQKRTAFGKFVAAIGSSPEAVRHSGLNIGRIKLICYGLSGLSTALGAILLGSILFNGDPTIGSPYLLLIVAVVIVGGTSLSGGSGGIVNTLLGALTIAITENALQMIGISVYYHPIIIGIIMIAAVAISLDKERVQIVK